MEAVLDFGRGCQNLAIILRGVWGGGGVEIERRPAPCYHMYRGGGGVRGEGVGKEGRERANLSLALNTAMCM
jgi:hypothetical protein